MDAISTSLSTRLFQAYEVRTVLTHVLQNVHSVQQHPPGKPQGRTAECPHNVRQRAAGIPECGNRRERRVRNCLQSNDRRREQGNPDGTIMIGRLLQGWLPWGAYIVHSTLPRKRENKALPLQAGVSVPDRLLEVALGGGRTHGRTDTHTRTKSIRIDCSRARRVRGERDPACERCKNSATGDETDLEPHAHGPHAHADTRKACRTAHRFETREVLEKESRAAASSLCGVLLPRDDLRRRDNLPRCDTDTASQCQKWLKTKTARSRPDAQIGIGEDGWRR